MSSCVGSCMMHQLDLRRQPCAAKVIALCRYAKSQSCSLVHAAIKLYTTAHMLRLPFTQRTKNRGAERAKRTNETVY